MAYLRWPLRGGFYYFITKTKRNTMGNPAFLGAIMSAGSNQMSNLSNIIGSQITGWQNRRFAREMYQRSHDDNIKLWEMNNMYNTPAMQRQRLIDAGLNPALMYGGKGGGGVASSTPSGGSPQMGNTTHPASRGISIMNEMYGLQAKKAQAEMLEYQTELIKREMAGKIHTTYHKANIARVERDALYEKDGITPRDFNKYSGERMEKQRRILLLDEDLKMKKMMNDFYEKNQWMKYLSILGGTYKNIK